MAGADDYAAWIVENQSKKGTPEFDTVAEAYKLAKGETVGAEPYAFDNPLVPSLMNIGQGFSLGFGDEIAGAVGTALGKPDTKDRYRQTVANFEKEYPVGSAVGKVGGGMLLPLPIKMMGAAPLVSTMTLGGVAGAIQGAGDAPDARQAIPDAGVGLISGMTLAPALLGATKGTGSVLSALGTKLPIVGDDITQWLARRHVARSLTRDNTTADEVGKRMVSMGNEARIADAAGENTRGVLNINAYQPGQTANNLEDLIRARIESRPERMDTVVDAVSGGVKAKDLVAALEKQQKDIATPLYQKAHSQSVPADDDLIATLDAARKLGAFSEAKTIATAEKTPFSLDNMTSGAVTSSRNTLTNQSTSQVTSASQLAVRDIDYVKRGLDSLIEANTNEFGKVNSKGRAFIGLKNDLLSRMNVLSPEFQQARQAFAGPEAMKSAVRKGKSFWNEDAESLGSLVDGMADSEKQAFQIGAAQKLREMVGEQSGQNRLLDIWKNRNTKEKLQALLGDDVKFAEVEKFLRGEMTLKRLERLGPSRNSVTAQVKAGSDNQAAENLTDSMTLGADVARGSVVGPVTKAIQMMSRAQTPEPVRDAIGQILMKQYMPAELKALMETQEAIRKASGRVAKASGVAGAQAGQSGKDLFK